MAHIPYREAPPEIESRTTALPVAIRSAASGARRIGGYASVFGRRSEPLGGFVEQVDRRFFNKSQGDGWQGVVARFNHENAIILGATQSGMLRLRIDDIGLDYTVDLPETRADIWELVGRGDVSNSSFAFQCFDDSWGYADGTALRTLLSGKLIDVSPVTTPAYRDSTVALRSLARFVDAPIEDVIEKAECNELRRFLVRTDIDGGRPSAKPMSGRQAMIEILSKRWPDGSPRSEARPMTGRQALLELMSKRNADGSPRLPY